MPSDCAALQMARDLTGKYLCGFFATKRQNEVSTAGITQQEVPFTSVEGA